MLRSRGLVAAGALALVVAGCGDTRPTRVDTTAPAAAIIVPLRALEASAPVTQPPTTTTSAAPAPPPSTPAPPPAPQAPSTGTWGDPGDDATWDRLAQCESGGDWSINTGNGYYGGIQFALSSWRSVGGVGYPHEASREEQIRRGRLLWQAQGWGAWPACSSHLGYR